MSQLAVVYIPDCNNVVAAVLRQGTYGASPTPDLVVGAKGITLRDPTLAARGAAVAVLPVSKLAINVYDPAKLDAVTLSALLANPTAFYLPLNAAGKLDNPQPAVTDETELAPSPAHAAVTITFAATSAPSQPLQYFVAAQKKGHLDVAPAVAPGTTRTAPAVTTNVTIVAAKDDFLVFAVQGYSLRILKAT